jgi:hypothetical protein
MSQVNSAEFIPDSDPLLAQNNGEATEVGTLSNWTSVSAIAPISESDRQLLDSHVEQLVDDLVHQELDKLFTEPLKPDPVEDLSPDAGVLVLKAPSLAYPLALAASQETSNLAVYAPPESANLEDEIPSPANTAASQLHHLQTQSWQDRLLLSSGILAVFVMLLGTVLNQMHWWPLRLKSGALIAQMTRDRDPFLVYLQQALKRVNDEALKSPQKVAIAASAPPLSSVVVPVAPSLPPTPVTHVAAHSTPKKAVTPITLAVAPAPPKPPSVTLQAPVTTLPSPPPMGELTLAVPALSPAGTAGLLPPPPTNSEQIAQPAGIPNLSPNLSYVPPTVVPPAKMVNPPAANRPARTLTGVMQMGDQSLALIEVNGVTRRIRLGETISADGAVLMQVGEQEAIVQKGQEQFTIQVGQRF